MAKIDEQISYNWLFFLLAGAFGAVTFWAVYDETVTRREYKAYQENFFQIETSMAEKAWHKALCQLEGVKEADCGEYVKAKAEKKTPPAIQRVETPYNKLTQQRDALKEQQKAQAAAFQQAKKEFEEAEFEAFDKAQDYTFTKSKLDEEYYYFTLAKHEITGETAKDSKAYKEFEEHSKKYADYEKELEQDRLVAEAANAKLAVVKKKVDTFEVPLKTAEKQLEDLARPIDELRRRYEAALERRDGPFGGIFGPGTEIVQQNLEDIGRVDRCESCHVGSNRGGFETVPQAEFRSHPYRRTLFAIHPVEKFGCTTCHDGQGRATTKFYSHAPVDNPHDFEKHFWEASLLRGPYMESECRQCHRQEVDLRSNLRCEVDAECPKEAPKCGPLSAPLNPATSLERSIDAKVEEGKFCGTPNGGDADKVDAVMVDLAPHLSRGRKIIEEAACYGCHPIEGYENRPKAGPDLRHAAAKLNSGWMIDWIVNPKAFRPKTRMPNFFPERLHLEEYPEKAKPVYADGVAAIARVTVTDPEKRARELDLLKVEQFQPEQQAAMMTSFLFANSTPYALPSAVPAGDAKRGEKLADTLGCYGCHSFTKPGQTIEIKTRNRASHFDHGPDLGNVGSKTTPEWLFAWLKDPKSYAPGTRMPDMRLSDQEAADIVAFLAGNKFVNGKVKEYAAAASVDPKNPDHRFLGRKLVNYYGCYGCHTVTGFEQTAGVGAELTEFGHKEVSRLDYGDYIVHHKQQTWEAWLENKLKHPRVYRYERVDTKMPQFDLTPDEIQDVMVVMKGMRGRTKDDDVRGHKLSAREQARERGRELVRWYNCYGCHTVDGHTGDIRQLALFQGADDTGADRGRLAPPILTGEGGKTQPPWLFGFLKQPVVLRQSLTVRMPTFGFSDAESTTLVEMFSAIDNAEFPYHDYSGIKLEGERRAMARSAFEAAQCLRCHSLTDKVTPDQAAIGAPNLLLTKTRLRSEWLARWLKDPQVLAPGVNMPSFFSSGNPLAAADQNPQTANLPGISQIAKMDGDSVVLLLRDFLMTLESPSAPTASK